MGKVTKGVIHSTTSAHVLENIGYDLCTAGYFASSISIEIAYSTVDT